MPLVQIRRVPLFKKPMHARCLLYVLLLLASGSTAIAQEAPAAQALTETEAVARALRRAPLRDAVEGAVAAERGRGRAASATPNPQLQYAREQTFGSLGTGEDYLSVAQAIDLGGRRGLHGDAGEARARAAELEGDATRVDVAAEARRRFYEVLYRQARLSAVEGWLQRIDQALQIVTRREERGDAAVYDRRRLERERAVANGRLATDLAALDRSRARLVALLGDNVSASVSGTLLPEADPAALPTLRAASSARPDLAALRLRVDAAVLEQSAAARWWAPDLQLEGGFKGIGFAGSDQRTDGFSLGASLSVPLWDQSRGLAQAAEGEARTARAQRSLIESELDGELAGAREEAVRLRSAAAELRDKTATASGDLVRIASAGYEGGELGLLELLDAYRGAADDALSVLDMELAARRARIELDQLTGTGLP